MKRVAEVLASPDLTSMRRDWDTVTSLGAAIDKRADEELLPLIREIVDERPTYGYPRTTAVLNRRLRATGRGL